MIDSQINVHFLFPPLKPLNYAQLGLNLQLLSERDTAMALSQRCVGVLERNPLEKWRFRGGLKWSMFPQLKISLL